MAVDVAKEITDTTMRKYEMDKKFFTMIPICAKVCEGYDKLEGQDWETLRTIAVSSGAEVKKILRYGEKRFAEEDRSPYDKMGCKENRRRLIELVGRYGIVEITKLLRQGYRPEEMKPLLEEICGIHAVRNVISSHFANRVFLIKAQYVFNYLNNQVWLLAQRPGCSRELKELCEDVKERIEVLQNQSQLNMKELEAVQMYYNGQLDFDDETAEDFLRLAGERGRSVEKRLGVEFGCPLEDMAGIALEKRMEWKEIESEERGRTKDVAGIISRSCDRMYNLLTALCE